VSSTGSESELVFDDYLERKKRGEAVDFDELCAAHPHLADQLRGHKRRWDMYGDLLQEPSAKVAIEAGRVVAGKYELVRRLGGGGFGQVWLAKQLPSLQLVALKLAHSDEFDLERAAMLRQALSKEAMAMGRSKHPGIVSLLDSGVDGDIGWMAMEHVDGSDLKQGLMETRTLHERGELPDDYDKGVATLLAKVCDAMQAAHDAGVIHRDLKPDNIMVADAEPKVADFGLARIEDLSLSRTGSLAGTYYYMSPEQVRMLKVNDLDSRTDIFSLGVVLYELIALAKPFQGDTAVQITEQILARDPQDPRWLRSKAAPELCVIAAKAMEKDRERRYQSMREFGDDLRRFVADEPILARPPTRVQLLRKWIRRHPVAASVISVASVAGVAISVLAVFLYYAEKQSEERRRVADEQRQLAERRRLGLLQVAVDGIETLEAKDRLPGATTPANIQSMQDWLVAAGKFAPGSPDATSVDLIQRDIETLRQRASGSTAASAESESPLETARYWSGMAQAQLDWWRALWGRTPMPDPAGEIARLQQNGLLPADLGDADAVIDACEDVVGRAPGVMPSSLFLSDRKDMVGLHMGAVEALRRLRERPLEEQRSSARRCLLQRAVWWLAFARGQLDDISDTEVARAMAEIRDLQLCKAHRIGEWEREAADLREMRGLMQRWRRQPEQLLEWAQRDADLLARVEGMLLRDWTFDDPRDQRLHGELVDSLTKVAYFHAGFMGGSAGDGWDTNGRPLVRQRLQLAQEAQALDQSAAAQQAWDRVLQSVDANPAYAAAAWPSTAGLVRQAGLWPLGPDPLSGLEEFAVLGTGEIPVRDAAMTIKPATGHAVVLVLLPGGASKQRYYKENGRTVGANLQEGQDDFTISKEVAPYFLAKYELTRDQWRRLANPAVLDAQPDAWNGSPLLPVALVDWSVAVGVLGQAGLSLPTVAEWDLAAFATPQQRYVCDEESLLALHANLSDQARVELEKLDKSAGEMWDDGHGGLAAAGSYRPNIRGLHDMAGNVGEWCLDSLASAPGGHGDNGQWDDQPGGTGARTDGELRVVKGGSYANYSEQCEQGRSLAPYASETSTTVGIRPVWRLRAP
jgi:serine/threonine protein kinase/formylglycine-generating enzyme required for sulfatase activity